VGDCVSCLTSSVFVSGWVLKPVTNGPATGHYADEEGVGILRTCWSPCQILAVFVDSDSENGDVMLEVRWLYQSHEVKGLGAGARTHGEWGFEEVRQSEERSDELKRSDSKSTIPPTHK